MNLRGTVLDRKGNAVHGAVVSLQMKKMTDTTDYLGRFSFTSMNTASEKTGVPVYTVRPVRYNDGAILLENNTCQSVVLTLFDLKGKEIANLQNGHLSAGNYRFALPPFSRNQTFLIHARIGSVSTICRCIGSYATGFPQGNIPEKEMTSRSAEMVLEKVSVSHAMYDGATVSVASLDDSITLRLFPKVDYQKAMLMSPGDTFQTTADQIMLSFDSIADGRCGCNMLCEWEGSAALYFNLRIQDKTTGIVLNTYNKKEVAIGGYTLRLLEISPSCPSAVSENYRIAAAFYPVNAPAKTLVLEHFTTRDGKTVSGVCGSLCIDFPTYYFNSDKQELRYTYIDAPPAADTTLLIYGSGVALMNDAGSGAASGLTGVDAFPYTDGEVTINSISENGTITLMYNGAQLVIPPGTSLMDTTHTREANGGNCLVDITQVDRISNFGFLLPYQIVPNY